jgi:transketolase
MRNELIQFLEAKKDTPEFEKLIFITGDLGFSVVEPLRALLGPRFINAGIAEALMASMAAGLASEGYKVYIYSIIPFVTFRCLEQIRNDICYHNLDVTVAGIGSGYGYGTLGPTHHSTEDLAAMAALPNMTVFNPGDLSEAEWAFTRTWEEPGPKYLRLSKGGDSRIAPCQNEKIGAAWQVKKGGRLTVVTTGTTLPDVLSATSSLGRTGEDMQIISIPQMKPFPFSALENLLNPTQPVVVVSELNPYGGLAGYVALCANSRGARVLRTNEAIDGFAKVPGSASFQRRWSHLDVQSISEMLATVRNSSEYTGTCLGAQ